ncbi:MAG: hypothetical protein WBV73_23970, partial [Phormidium sp.]
MENLRKVNNLTFYQLVNSSLSAGILNLTDFGSGDKMLDLVSLRKTGTGWEFASEAALEDFIWLNLPELFGLTPLKRQYSV